MPTFVVTVDTPLPEVNDRAPLDVRVPEPVIVALPLVPVDKVMPPLAVTAPLTPILLAFVVTDRDPEPSLLAFSCIAPVWLTVTEPPLVVLANCAAAVVTVVAAVPALIVKMPLVDNVPEPDMVFDPLTPNVIPPLAVIPPAKLRLPPLVLKLTDAEPPKDIEEDVASAPLAVTVNALGDPEIVPIVRDSDPCVIVTAPVSFTFNVATSVFSVARPPPAVKESAEVEFNVPPPAMVPAPAVVRLMPPLAVTELFTTMLLPLLVVTDSDPAPSVLVSNWILPVCERVIDPPLVVLASWATAVVSDVEALPAFTVNVPDEVNSPEPVIVPVPAVPSVIPPLAVVAPLTEILLPLFVVTDSEPAPSLLAFN